MFEAASPSDTSLMQDPAFAVALQSVGQCPIQLPCGLTVFYRRVLGLPLAMLPRAAPPSDLCEQLRSQGLQNVPLILSPEAPCQLPRALRLRGPATVLSIDLTVAEQSRRAALHGKWRNQLAKAEVSPLRVKHAQMRPDHPLLTLEAQQARARRYAGWPPALTAAFAAWAPDQTRIFTALNRGHPVAHMLFLRHGLRATYHIGHISERGKFMSAHNLLLWQASCWLAQQGHTGLDLGLEDPATPGLTRFKRRAGGQPEPTGGTWLRWRPLARGRAA